MNFFFLPLLILLSTVFFDYHMRSDYLVEVSSLRGDAGVAEQRRMHT